MLFIPVHASHIDDDDMSDIQTLSFLHKTINFFMLETKRSLEKKAKRKNHILWVCMYACLFGLAFGVIYLFPLLSKFLLPSFFFFCASNGNEKCHKLNEFIHHSFGCDLVWMNVHGHNCNSAETEQESVLWIFNSCWRMDINHEVDFVKV